MPHSDFVHESILQPLIRITRDMHESAEPVDTHGSLATQSRLERLLTGADYVDLHGLPFELHEIPAFVNVLLHKNSVDDRKFLLEDLLTLMARLPPGSELGTFLQTTVIDMLYKDLPHPPDNWLGPPPNAIPPNDTPVDVPYAYRSADGSWYNQLYPSMGMARTPYARTVSPKHNLNRAELPRAEDVYDQLLRRDKFVEHPSGMSALFFAFANLVIHSIFNTDMSTPGWTKNNVSSYLDLSPLYGSSPADNDAVRRKDGTGRLWNDVFADARPMLMPPSTPALLILFNRNHNYIAEKILAINENGTYSNPPPSDPAQLQAQDEEIFQRARLVNCGFFMAITLGDYVAAILGLVRDGITWRLDPRIDIRESDHAVSPMGGGNVCSIEFNLMYRWHATLSEPDAEWIQVGLEGILGKDPSTATVEDFMKAMVKLRPTKPVQQWEFAGLKRGANGRFSDADLANVLQSATAASASAYKARGTPEALRIVEVMSIEQSRKWGSCSMNEFRKFMGLKPYASFEDWNPDHEIYTAAQELYRTIDNLELHVGLQAEASKPVMPGAGLCPGFTISRAILADAVALVRGDRFMTVDNTPGNLTSWGFQDTQTDPTDGSYGGMITRLLFRHLPDYYPPGSAYAHFPFLVPGKMKAEAAKWADDVVSKYDWNRPAVPVGPVIVARKPVDVEKALTDETDFRTSAAERLDILTRGVGVDASIVRTALCKPEMISHAIDSLVDTLHKLISSAAKNASAYKKGASPYKYIDIVGDVINLLPVHWISNEIAGVALKTAENPHGYKRPGEEYRAYAGASHYVYFNNDPCEDWSLREQGLQIADEITGKVKQQIGEFMSSPLNPMLYIHKVTDWYTAANDHNDESIKALCTQLKGHDGQRARESLAASVFAEYIPTAPLFSKVIAHVVNFYLDDAHAAARMSISGGGKAVASESEILTFIYEALRSDPPVPTVLLTAKNNTSIEGTPVVTGQKVLASLVEANLDATAHANSKTRLEILGLDQRGLLAPEYFEKVAPRLIHEIFKLPNIRRQSGYTGRFSRFTDTARGLPQTTYLTSDNKLSPFPSRLVVEFDA